MITKQYNPDAIPVPEQGTASYQNIHQLFKKPANMDRHNVFPVTYTQSVYDGKTGANLEHILHQFNHIFLQYQGSGQATRNLLPKDMRRKGIMISYRDMSDNIITERNIDESESTNDNWGLDKYWEAVEGYNIDDLKQYIQNIIDELKQLIENQAGDIINNAISNYINGDEFQQLIENKLQEILNQYLDDNLEDLVGGFFEAIVEYLRDNERVIANALARHEQAITDLQNAQ